MGERGRRLDSGNNQKSDSDKSQSSYSDDDYCCVSDYFPPISTQSTNTEGRSQKAQKLKTLVHYQASKHPVSKYATSKKEMCQSLNRESSLKELPSLAAKRVLSSHQLKIDQLRNELTEVHLKLEEQLKENRSLKQLQYKHEKIIQKYEEAEHEVSHLLARHSEEIRVQKELLRRSQENKETTERKLKTVEDELCKAKGALQKVTRLAEDRELPLRKELTKKVTSLQSQLEDNEKRIKNLEKKINLNSNSFQRQLLSERKKLDEAQEINKSLQEEIQQLNKKLKDKERRLEAINIDAYRMSKPSPRKDIKITPRKKEWKREEPKRTENNARMDFCSCPENEEHNDLIFGSYAPSIGKGYRRPTQVNKKSAISEETDCSHQDKRHKPT